MNQFSLHLPFNAVSYGITSTAITREIFRRGLSPNILPIGPVDLSSQKKDQDFELFLSSCINKTLKMHKRSYPVCRLWHTNALLDSISDKRISIVFHETDQITDTEKNILEQQNTVFVTSNFTKEVFEEYGLTNVKYLPLGFDSFNFQEKPKKIKEDKIVWSLNSKREVRKATDRIVNLWVSKYGNSREHQLNLACFNPFFRKPDGQVLNPDEQKAMFIHQVFGGRNYWNVNFIPWMNTLAEVSSMYNYTDIDLSGLSLCEGFNLPLFTHLCLGKHAVVLDAHVHKDYATAENSVLVEPTSKIKAVDGLFFHENGQFLQGNWYNWQDNDVLAAMDKAVERFKANPANEAGRQLKNTFTWEKTVDTIFSVL